MRRKVLLLVASTGLAVASPAGASDKDYLDLSLEELRRVEVTTVAKTPRALSSTPAAVYVLTQEDVRRSGYTSVADALRMVPGVDVARVDSSTWNIGIRGFNTGLSNKLLVLIDGRSVYSPLFSGVFWELQDVPVEELDRIEVVRGPGGTLWGANAVNGVINIITRRAAEDRGGLVHAGGGTEERGFGYLRYGGRVGEVDYRASGRFFARDETHGGDDAWQAGSGTLRVDAEPSDRDSVSVHARLFRAQLDEQGSIPLLTAPFNEPVDRYNDRAGTSLLARWDRELGEGSDLSLQTYYDYTDFDFIQLSEKRHTFDVEFQHRLPWLDANELIWGGGYRASWDSIDASVTTTLDPDSRDVHVFSAFLQNRISLLDDRLEATLGTKLEHNPYTGFEFQPGAELGWTPTERHTLWVSVARAVRTPSRLEDDADLASLTLAPGTFAPDPTLVVVRGSNDVERETLLAVDAGYRSLLSDSVSMDLAIFYNRYRDLLASRLGAPEPGVGPPDHLILPIELFSDTEGHSYGGELSAQWQVLPWWRLSGWYSYLRIDLDGAADSLDPEAPEDSSPQHQFFLRSSMDLPLDLALDAMLRAVSELDETDVDGYVELDLRLAWRATERLELSIVGQNLLDSHHAESGSAAATEIQRGAYGQVRWEF